MIIIYCKVDEFCSNWPEIICFYLVFENDKKDRTQDTALREYI